MSSDEEVVKNVTFEDSDSEDEGDESGSRKIYNAQAMLQKLDEIKRDDNIPWIEFPVINSGFVHDNIDPDDDFAREVSFYKQVVAGCTEARVRMEMLGVKYKRPDDYFAEMLKTDAHMAKVRQNLLDQQKRIESVEERRRQKELKRFGKKVQIEKEQTRAKQKKAEVEAIKKWRKDQKRNGSTGEGEQQDIEQVLAEAKKIAISGDNSEKKKANLKRKRKDSQYGYGGVRKKAKKNTADSASDMSQFNAYKNKSVDADLHPKIPQFARNKGPKRRKAQPKKVHRIGK